MSTSKNIHTSSGIFTSVIGETEHRNYMRLQAAYGVAQRGGTAYPLHNEAHRIRLVSDVNILSSQEHRQLVFSEIVFSN